jgi:Tol biopolymer transport system component
VRSFNALEAEPLPGTEGGDFPFWSPDSRFVGFFADGKLKKIDVTGGPAQTLSNAPSGEGGTWNRDGIILFGSAGGIFRVSAVGGQPTSATTLPASQQETSHRWPDFLPDGRHFLYLAQPSNTIYIGSLDSAETKSLLHADSKALYSAPGYLLFVRDGTLLCQPFDASRTVATGDVVPIAEQVRSNSGNGRAAFSVSPTVLAYRADALLNSQLVWFDRTGKQIGALGDPAMYRDVHLSSDGKRAAVNVLDRASRSSDIWLYDVIRGIRTRFTFDAANDEGAHWSPGGDQVVFRSLRNPPGLYVKSSNGASSEQILLAHPTAYPDSWSPDGRFLIYEIDDAKTTWDLWVLPLSSDGKPRAFLQAPARQEYGQFSPDGHWVAYRSNESGRFEVYVAPFSGPGGKWQISTAGGDYPSWRSDGKEIFYLAPDSKLMAAGVDGQGSGFEVGDVRPLFETRLQSGNFPYAVSADGQQFLMNIQMAQTSSDPITVVVNWAAGLKK